MNQRAVYFEEAAICKFKMGVVVKFDTPYLKGVGHVVGFTLNSTSEVIVLVRIPTFLEREGRYYKDEPFHTCNLTVVSDV